MQISNGTPSLSSASITGWRCSFEARRVQRPRTGTAFRQDRVGQTLLLLSQPFRGPQIARQLSRGSRSPLASSTRQYNIASLELRFGALRRALETQHRQDARLCAIQANSIANGARTVLHNATTQSSVRASCRCKTDFHQYVTGAE